LYYQDHGIQQTDQQPIWIGHPKLTITKEVSAIPKIRVTKIANLSDTMITESNDVTIDYDVLIESNIGVPPDEVVVVDSFPSETVMIVHDDETMETPDSTRVLRYTVGSPGEKQIKQTIQYSLDETEVDAEQFLTNNLYIEGAISVETKKSTKVKSSPVELSVGPFILSTAGEIDIRMTVAHFITSKAFFAGF